MGKMIELGGGVFLDRSSPGANRAAIEQVADLLRAGRSVCVFPEATTTDGTTLLDFRSAFFEASVLAAAPVVPAAIAYRTSDGTATSVAWLGDESPLRSLFAVLRSKSPITATVQLRPRVSATSRLEIARRARQSIAAALGLTMEERSHCRDAHLTETMTEGEASIFRIIANALKEREGWAQRSIDPTHTLEQLDLDSLSAIPVLLALEKHLARDLPDDALLVLSPSLSLRRIVSILDLNARPDRSERTPRCIATRSDTETTDDASALR